MKTKPRVSAAETATQIKQKAPFSRLASQGPWPTQVWRRRRSARLNLSASCATRHSTAVGPVLAAGDSPFSSAKQ